MESVWTFKLGLNFLMLLHNLDCRDHIQNDEQIIHY